MIKIKELLEQAGLSSELAEKICESLASYKDSIREQFQRDYSAKVEQAKRVCVEETEAHKRDLARRLQIFCETKGSAIEAQIAKQSALNESAAVSRLNQISAMLNGIEHNGSSNGNVTAAKYERKLKLALEDKKRAVEIANRKNAIAEKALKRNRQLTAQLQSLQEQRSPSISPVTESRQNPAKRRIDVNRGNGQARSTRATMTESQDRRPVPRNTKPITGAGTGYNIADIAAVIDEDLI